MHLYLIASTPYGFLHHRFQKLADKFRAKGIHVTYIEQTHGWRAYLSRQKRGLAGNILRSLGFHILAIASMGFSSLRSKPAPRRRQNPIADFEIIEMPLVIPTQRLDSPFVEKLSTAVFRQVLRRKVFREQSADMRSVAVVDNPLWGLALERNDFGRIYYDCIDDISLYAGLCSIDRFQSYEMKLLNISDGAFVTASKLEEHIRSQKPDMPIYRIPNGVDDEWFRQQAKQGSVPTDLAAIKRPTVGYVGTLSEWVDFTLINNVARALPDVSFVFVGPMDYKSRAGQLCSSQNIFWLGRKAYSEVPLYINAFDVCWIPFSSGRITENTNPIKLFEYFALGKPVVTTRMPEAERYHQSGLVYVGNTVDSMVTAVLSALEERDEDKRSHRLKVANEHSWDALVEKMELTVAGEHD